MKERARELRKNMTDAERHIWSYLRNRRLLGYRFARQYVIGTYIVDFICREKRLIIELDGGQHMDAVVYDENRTRFLMAQGYQVLRFWNNEALYQTQDVLDHIVQALEHETKGYTKNQQVPINVKTENRRLL